MTGRKAAISNIDQVAQKFHARAHRAGNPQPFLKDEAVEILETSERTLWASQGSALGIPWAPLTARTIAQKLRSGNPDALVESGGLKDSFTDSSAPGAIRRSTRNRLEFGSGLGHAHLHQDGTRGGQLPRRTVLKVAAPTREAAVRALKDWWLTGQGEGPRLG